MHVETHATIDDLGADRLAALAGSRLDFSHGLLRAVERSLWGHLGVRYLTVVDGGAIAAFIPVYTGSNLNVNVLMPRWVQRSYDAMVRQLGAGAAYHVVVVGSLISDRGWIPMHPECGDPGAVLDLLLAAVEEIARAERAPVSFLKDIHADFPAALTARLHAAGYRQSPSLPTVRVDTDVPSFDDYLSRHLSKNGRKHARKTLRHAEAGLEVRTVADFEPLVPVVYPLFRRTFLKARFRFEELLPRFFVECARSRQPRSELVVCEQDGAVVGALLILYDQHEQANKRIGIDYRRADSGLIYNLLNYRGIQRAIERRLPTVHLGQSTYLIKTRIGGALEDQFVYARPRNLGMRLTLPLQRLWTERYRAARVAAGLRAGASI
jgi:Acetyltransferase (GNAT) domain